MNKTFENCTLLDTYSWFAKARPNVTAAHQASQLGVHLEEVTEMLDAISVRPASMPFLMDARRALHKLAEEIKTGKAEVEVIDDVEFLDSLCDQTVTATGVAYTYGYDYVGAMNEVNASNFSKFDEMGNPIFNEQMKVMKGPNYFKAQLEPFTNQD